MNNAAIIATLKSNMAAAEAAIAALPAGSFVIVWHGSCLKTDGKTVSLLGSRIYADDNGPFMRSECAAWNARIPAGEEQAQAMSKAEALAHVSAQNAALLAAIPK